VTSPRRPLEGGADQSELEQVLLGVAERAARAAGAELVARFDGPAVDVRTKSTSTDPVSAADIAAEAAIRQVLAHERPHDAILGEEGGATPGDGARGLGSGGLRWVVDPLDGTVNYLYRLPTFAVSVACEDADGGLVGVVLNPISGECFWATRSGPALRAGAAGAPCEEITHRTGPHDLGHALVGTGFSYDPDVRAAQGRVAARLLPRVRDIRRAGAAALDLGWCAFGRLDAFYERGVHAWDIAAGSLICERVGLVVRPLAEVPAVDGNVGLPFGVLVAPPVLIDELQALVAGPAPE
jgi:myo-inositol-1(or 4)-monophosphatase